MKVKNNKAINNLALSGIKNNIKKYALLSIAVILTTLMFSSFFTIVGSILNELQLASMRRAGGSAHAEIKYLCQSEYDILKKDSKFKDISYRIVVGFVRDERLKKLNVEVNYFEPLNAKGSFCYPEEGRMPEAENEIVLSDLTLKELGVPKEIGSEFSLDLLIGNEVKTYDFVLCGSYRGDPISFAQQALVSEKFQQKYAPVKQTSFFEETDFNYSGYIMADINFRNSFNIQKKLDKLMSRTGLNNSNSGVNWAYMTSSIDPLTIVLMIMFLAIFFFAGYLIIYNIFYLNIISDTQEYGLLKTIGTTGKQIRQIVLRRASLLSLFGIPIGLILGIGVGAYLLPVITEDLNTVSFDKGKVHLNVWIILLAVVFSYVTVIISSLRPCKNAARVSPIEALKFTEKLGKNGKPKRKKVIVILSLSLALVVLNSTFGILSGLDLNTFIEKYTSVDFSIQDAGFDNPSMISYGIGVDNGFWEAANEQDSIENIGRLYFEFEEDTPYCFDDITWEKIENRLLKTREARERIEYSNRYNPNFDVNVFIENLNKTKSLEGKLYGMDEFVVSKLDVIETLDGSDKIDMEKFMSGKYVLLNQFNYNGSCYNALDPGDKVLVRNKRPEYFKPKYFAQDGTPYILGAYDEAPLEEYEVLALVEIPLPIERHSYYSYDFDCILPPDEFLNICGDRLPERVLIDVKNESEEEFETWIKDYTENENDNLSYISKASVEEEYKSTRKTIISIGFVLVVILSLIGLLNYANTIIASIMVRKREFAMLEAVGMTGKQQIFSMVREGLGYFVWTAIVSTVLSTVVNIFILRNLMDGTAILIWHFTLLPLIICLPLFLILSALIPVASYSVLNKKSVVERLRVE